MIRGLGEEISSTYSQTLNGQNGVLTHRSRKGAVRRLFDFF